MLAHHGSPGYDIIYGVYEITLRQSPKAYIGVNSNFTPIPQLHPCIQNPKLVQIHYRYSALTQVLPPPTNQSFQSIAVHPNPMNIHITS